MKYVIDYFMSDGLLEVCQYNNLIVNHLTLYKIIYVLNNIRVDNLFIFSMDILMFEFVIKLFLIVDTCEK